MTATARGAAAWTGILPSLCTPFSADGGPDLDGVEAVTDFSVGAGAHGIVCLGLAGEVDTLSVDERRQIITRVLATVDGRVPVLVGAAGPNLAASRELAEHAEASGADGIVLPPPANLPLSDEEQLTHFTSVARSVSLPVVIQNAPEFIPAELGTAVAARAIERAENIRAIKLELGPEGLEHWAAALGDGIALYAGSGGMYLLDALDAGAAGVMPGCDLTDRLVAVYAAWREGDRSAAEEQFHELLPMLVWQNREQLHSNRCVKEVLRRRGLAINPELRPPAQATLDRRALARLDRYLAGVRLDAARL